MQSTRRATTPAAHGDVLTALTSFTLIEPLGVAWRPGLARDRSGRSRAGGLAPELAPDVRGARPQAPALADRVDHRQSAALAPTPRERESGPPVVDLHRH